MCARYTQHHTAAQITERFEVKELQLPIRLSYNIAPGQIVAAILEAQGRQVAGLKWGLVPFWAKDPSVGSQMINARSETLRSKPAFRQALRQRRCLVPADGFFEWTGPAKKRQPMHIRLRNQELFAFAGLWEEWQSPANDRLRTCTIVTVPANALIQPIHPRMPAMLGPKDHARWLDPNVRGAETAISLLRPYPAEEMELYPVSAQVNSPAVDDPTDVPIALKR
ncbi:MAG TPA: SOS response-associated peptidase [Candidatus Paceibacterota bacterium]|nr:SOS response-associated peptidase [Verrucomicrobiota bacterium]HRY51755.1 SOS response-associated peptidase [Candidatus Paceibacterota bacterium]HSA02374.1 SOS response-associated peptidase [Candidatus Paceibacterota bacterium]